jgi:hypothetical protein
MATFSLSWTCFFQQRREGFDHRVIRRTARPRVFVLSLQRRSSPRHRDQRGKVVRT